MPVTNNVTRLLDANGIAYTAYELPNQKLSADEVAEFLGVDPGQVFKTIVVLRQRRGKPILAVVPGPLEVSLKLLAKAVGEKKVASARHAEAEELTGLQTGGISALALLNKGFEIVLDETAQLFEQIYMSGGQRGLNVLLSPNDFVALTEAQIAEIAE
ncbi:MAG: aminoacyl-tRNA deacylase [Anaerolineales bacterium]|nr:aminoacyl-tRNA deacylase [Anaerolineales bacterium]